MKKFNLKDFNKDGNVFCKLSYKFDISNGLIIEESEKSVQVKSNQSPYQGCDFIADHCSLSSKYFFEVSGINEPNDTFFTATQGFSINGFLYVLPENLSEVKTRLESFLKEWINHKLDLEINLAQRAKDVL